MAVLGAGLQVLGLASEWLLHPQAADGTVRDPFTFSAGVLLWLAGTALMVAVLLALGRRLSRAGRVGAWLGIVGNAALVVSGVCMLVTGLLTGRPAEWSFLFFALGYLLALVGYPMLGLGLRRSGHRDARWLLPIVAAAGIVVAIGVEADPWHDLGLTAVSVAWMAFGLVEISAGPDRAPTDARPFGRVTGPSAP